MYNSFRGKSSDDRKGGKRFGGGFGGRSEWKPRGASRGFGDRDGARPALFDATCAECGNGCQVPFRPNGSKPVLCNNCFRKDGGPEPRRFDRGDRGGFDKPAFREPRFPSQQDGNGKVEAQLKEINQKLDSILKALNESEEV